MTVSELLRWVPSVSLALLGGYILILNYWVVILWYWKRESHSLIPLLGGIFLGVALLGSPNREWALWAWVPLILDLGCAYVALSFLYSALILRCFRR